MTDLIRRDEIGPRLAAAGFGGELLQTAIAALPAALAHPLADEARAALANDDVSGWIGSLPAAPIAEALAVPEVATLLSAAIQAQDGLMWAKYHLKRHNVISTNVEIAFDELDAALRAIGERADG